MLWNESVVLGLDSPDVSGDEVVGLGRRCKQKSTMLDAVRFVRMPEQKGATLFGGGWVYRDFGAHSSIALNGWSEPRASSASQRRLPVQDHRDRRLGAGEGDGDQKPLAVVRGLVGEIVVR